VLLEEYHADGCALTSRRTAQTTPSTQRESLGNVNAFGTKLLRELGNTVALMCPAKFLIAEDHTGCRQ